MSAPVRGGDWGAVASSLSGRPGEGPKRLQTRQLTVCKRAVESNVSTRSYSMQVRSAHSRAAVPPPFPHSLATAAHLSGAPDRGSFSPSTAKLTQQPYLAPSPSVASRPVHAPVRYGRVPPSQQMRHSMVHPQILLNQTRRPVRLPLLLALPPLMQPLPLALPRVLSPVPPPESQLHCRL